MGRDVVRQLVWLERGEKKHAAGLSGRGGVV